MIGLAVSSWYSHGKATVMPEKLLPVHIVARRLGVSKATVRRLIRLGELKSINVKAGLIPQYRVPEIAFYEFLSKREEHE